MPTQTWLFFCASFVCLLLAAAPSVQARTILGGLRAAARYQQCGGKGGPCRGIMCTDAIWATCPAAYTCVRTNQWYRTCSNRPTTVPAHTVKFTDPSASFRVAQHSASASSGRLPPAAKYQQCGGTGGSCTGAKCKDGVWAQCPTAYTCTRNNQYYYTCLNSPKSAPTPVPTQSPTPTHTPTAAPTPASSQSAAIAAVTYPNTAPAPQNLDGGIFAQIPFRYKVRYGNPPLTRTGYYYLPSGWQNKKLPIMMMFHGLSGFGGIGGGKGGVGIMGSGSVITFQQQAEKYQYIMVAPDSQTDAISGWEIPFAIQPATPDVLHAQACLEYVMALPGVMVDMGHVVSAGVSNGGYMAAPVASRYSIYTHAMLFHATFTLKELQNHMVKIWISTGVHDSECTPKEVKHLANYFRQIFADWPTITYNVNYLVGHSLEDPLERVDAIHWWLGLGGYTAFSSASQLTADSSISNGVTHIGTLRSKRQN